MYFTPSGRSIDVKLLHLENARFPILVKDSGSFIEFNSEHLSNLSDGIPLRDVKNCNSSKDVIPLKYGNVVHSMASLYVISPSLFESITGEHSVLVSIDLTRLSAKSIGAPQISSS